MKKKAEQTLYSAEWRIGHSVIIKYGGKQSIVECTAFQQSKDDLKFKNILFNTFLLMVYKIHT